MATVWELRIAGLRELQAQFAALVKDLSGQEAARAYLAGARIIQRAAQANAPRSQYPAFTRSNRRGSGSTSTPGLLKRSIVSFKNRSEQNPAAYAVVNVRKSFAGGARAPHGHLVEFGTKPRTPKRGKRMVFVNKQGEYVFAKRVSGMAPQRFFKRAVDSQGNAALLAVEQAAAKIVERAIQRTL